MPKSLPPELDIAILEWIPDKKQLLKCSLVCQRWAWIAQRILWRNVQLMTFGQASAFNSVTTQATAKGKYLGAAVRTLKIRVDDRIMLFETLTSATLGPIPPQLFTSIILACPQLVELFVELWMVQPFPDPCFKALRSIAPIKALYVDNASNPTPPSMYQLLSLVPSIQVLEFHGTCDLHTPPEHVTLQKLSLRELAFHCDDASEEFLDWILSASPAPLETLTIWSPVSRGIFGAVVARHAQHLTSLRMRTCQSWQASLIGRCTRLREIEFDDTLCDTVVESFPSSLEHIVLVGSYGWHSTPSVQPLLTAIEKEKCPRLHTVTYNIDRRQDASEALRLKTACASRNLAFRSPTFPDELYESYWTPVEHMSIMFGIGRNLHFAGRT